MYGRARTHTYMTDAMWLRDMFVYTQYITHAHADIDAPRLSHRYSLHKHNLLLNQMMNSVHKHVLHQTIIWNILPTSGLQCTHVSTKCECQSKPREGKKKSPFMTQRYKHTKTYAWIRKRGEKKSRKSVGYSRVHPFSHPHRFLQEILMLLSIFHL